MFKREQYTLFIVALLIIAIGTISLFILNKESPSEIIEVTPSFTPHSSFIIVHVAGSVKNPGIYKLKIGSRVYNAIDKAGGALKFANLDALNLARILKDGEKVFVPEKETISKSNLSVSKKDISDAHHIDINSANEETLKLLPGVGDVLARRIVEYRKSHGPFSNLSELKKVSGIGEKKFAEIKKYIETH